MNDLIGLIPGVPVFVSASAVEIIRKQRRTHKKRRINKKWLKRYGMVEIKKPAMYLFNDLYGSKKLIVHPDIYPSLVKAAGR